MDFLAEQEESVGAAAYERVEAVISRLLHHLAAQGVTETSQLALPHVEGFLAAVTIIDAADTWHATKKFVTWLGRRGYAGSLSAEFKAAEASLRRTCMKQRI